MQGARGGGTEEEDRTERTDAGEGWERMPGRTEVWGKQEGYRGGGRRDAVEAGEDAGVG